MSEDKKITWNDITNIATENNIEPCLIQSVFTVETGGKSGILSDGRSVILFEGHVFWKELIKRKIDPKTVVKGNEDVLYPKWVKTFYKGGIKEYDRLNKAIKINEDAALCSASWGCFQVLGLNYKDLGFNTVQDFVNFINSGEKEQLKIFIKFCKVNSIFEALKNKNWEKFVRGYNGSGQVAYYSGELQKAYSKCLIQHKG
jgi:hypothetical protein